MQKPMTTAELFDKICHIIKEKQKIPDILDYQLAAFNPIPITDYQFDLKTYLNYGGSEGIYLDCWIELYKNHEKCAYDLGTFKTLRTDEEAMHIMAGLLADFIIEGTSYVNANLDDFTWTGADVHPINANGIRLTWGYSCRTMESALKEKDKLLEKYPKVVVRDNTNRKEKIYSRQKGEK